MKASPTERVAGCAFFLFTLLQVPYFIVDTNLAPHGMLELSPLQVTVANLAKTFPSHTSVLEYVLVPGGWVRGPLSYFIRCQFKTGGKGLCDAERARVTDLEFVIKNNLPIMVKLLETEGMSQQMPILYGSTMIVVASIFSLYYSVKTAVLGFALLAFGVVQGNHTPLPPGVLTAFLCVYSGFNLGEAREAQRKRAAARRSEGKQEEAGTSSAAAEPKAKASSSPAQAKTPTRKQQKRA